MQKASFLIIYIFAYAIISVFFLISRLFFCIGKKKTSILQPNILFFSHIPNNVYSEIVQRFLNLFRTFICDFSYFPPQFLTQESGLKHSAIIQINLLASLHENKISLFFRKITIFFIILHICTRYIYFCIKIIIYINS